MMPATSRSFVRSVAGLALAAALVCVGFAARADITEEPPEKAMRNVLESHKSKSYGDFLVDADDGIKAGITPQMFEGMSNQLAPRLKAGYKTVFVCKLRKQGRAVYLWKVEFTDGKDDVLLRIAIKDKKITTVLFQ
jgi:hypothetical protein